MAALSVLADRLAVLGTEAIGRLFKSEQEAEKLFSNLRKIERVMADAESRAKTNERVKDWLEHLEDVVCEMEDVLDECEVATIQEEDDDDDDGSDSDHRPWENKLCSLIHCPCSLFKLVVERRMTTRKMKALSERFGMLLKESHYTFPIIDESSAHPPTSRRLVTSAMIDEPRIIGHDGDKDSLVNMLVSDDNEKGTTDDMNAQVVSIVGIGGVGKTTLAQSAYKDLKVKANFDFRVWVCVSDPFDALAVAKAILKAIDFNHQNPDIPFGLILERINEFLSGKKFLIVLDDVWTEDPQNWEPLKRCLRGAPGSKILVTTRNQMVARMMGSVHVQRLGLLSDEDCWTILARTALQGRSYGEQGPLSDIGKEIAKKCNGLPLAAKFLGGLLASKSTKREWISVLENPWWMAEDEESDVVRILKLSYFELDPILKQCFLSCVVFPGDSVIRLDQLIRIWMAQGLLGLSTQESWYEIQTKGFAYFQQLSMRSFFQAVETEDLAVFQVDDTMRELAYYLSIKKRYVILDGGDSPDLSWRNFYLGSHLDEMIHTFCARQVPKDEEFFFPELIGRLRRVRMLIVSDCDLVEVPESIGGLIHLRYLDLSNNPIEQLPETISDLYFLQTLNLENSRRLSSLPRRIKKLINLRHLLATNTESLVHTPEGGLQQLTGLWTLSEFRCGRNCGGLGILGNLNQLLGSLRIVVDGEEEVSEAESANLKEKIHIQQLELIFLTPINREVIDALQPPPQLQTLLIEGGYQGAAWRPPRWINPTSLGDLKRLVIVGFDSLPPHLSTMPHLEKLKISRGGFKRVKREFFGNPNSTEGVCGFPKLKKLEFEDCRSWEEWEDIEEGEEQALSEFSQPLMPSLQELSIIGCPQLKALPHNLLGRATSLKVLSAVDSSDPAGALQSEVRSRMG